MTSPIIKYILWVVLLVYLLLLCEYILFDRINNGLSIYLSLKHIHDSIHRGIPKANFEPFAIIRLIFYSNEIPWIYKIKNLAGNLIGFMPMGILLPLLFQRLRGITAIAIIIFLISLLFEIIQLSTGLGRFDVDDIILNTTGGILGYLFYKIASAMFGSLSYNKIK